MMEVYLVEQNIINVHTNSNDTCVISAYSSHDLAKSACLQLIRNYGRKYQESANCVWMDNDDGRVTFQIEQLPVQNSV